MTNEELRNECTPRQHSDESMYDASHRVAKTRVNRDILFLPLLAVAEAAESVAKAERDFACGRLPPPGRNERLVNLETALADFAKAREGV
jgi:hypothetical protein